MGFIYALRSEQEKTKHTSFWAIHFCVPVMGALLFLAYYSLYASTAGDGLWVVISKTFRRSMSGAMPSIRL